MRVSQKVHFSTGNWLTRSSMKMRLVVFHLLLQKCRLGNLWEALKSSTDSFFISIWEDMLAYTNWCDAVRVGCFLNLSKQVSHFLVCAIKAPCTVPRSTIYLKIGSLLYLPQDWQLCLLFSEQSLAMNDEWDCLAHSFHIFLPLWISSLGLPSWKSETLSY